MANLFTKVVKIIWNFKIGAEINQLIMLEKTVSSPKMGNGLILVATESIISFVNFFKMFKFLNQCFARLRFWKSVSSKTGVAPSSRFCDSETLFQTEVVQNTDLRI